MRWDALRAPSAQPNFVPSCACERSSASCRVERSLGVFAKPEDDLARYWDELAAGGEPDPGNLDPTLAEAVRQLGAANDVSAANPEFVNRLLEELMPAATIELGRSSRSNSK